MSVSHPRLLVSGLFVVLAVLLWWRFDDLRALFSSARLRPDELRHRWTTDLSATQQLYPGANGMTDRDRADLDRQLGSLDLDLNTDEAVIRIQDQTWRGAFISAASSAATDAVVFTWSSRVPVLGARTVFSKVQGRVAFQFGQMTVILAQL